MYFIGILLLFQQVPGFPKQSDEIDGFLMFSNKILQGGDRVPVRKSFCSLQGTRAITFPRRKKPLFARGLRSAQPLPIENRPRHVRGRLSTPPSCWSSVSRSLAMVPKGGLDRLSALVHKFGNVFFKLPPAIRREPFSFCRGVLKGLDA